MMQSIDLKCIKIANFHIMKNNMKQESPPAWTQEAYRRPCSKCSLCWWGGTPSSHGRGVPHPVMVGGTPSSHGGGTQGTRQTPDLGWGTPPTIRPGMGYPTIQTWDGVPPHQTWNGVTLPPSRPGMGYPPQPMVNRQTFPSINITFPRTTYAGGNNCKSWGSLYCGL